MHLEKSDGRSNLAQKQLEALSWPTKQSQARKANDLPVSGRPRVKSTGQAHSPTVTLPRPTFSSIDIILVVELDVSSAVLVLLF